MIMFIANLQKKITFPSLGLRLLLQKPGNIIEKCKEIKLLANLYPTY
jgi:hypothetical protein